MRITSGSISKNVQCSPPLRWQASDPGTEADDGDMTENAMSGPGGADRFGERTLPDSSKSAASADH